MDFRCCGKRLKFDFHEMSEGMEADCGKCGIHYYVKRWNKNGETE